MTAAGVLLREAAQATDRAQPVTQVCWQRDWLDETAAEPRFTSFLSGAFAGVALILAAMGIYGVLAGAVAQRTRETGVRVAIGAARRQVVRMILRGGFTVAASGIASVWSPRLRSARYSKRRVTACDPVTYVVVGATLAAVALLACNVPAVRATRIDPLLALRCD